MKSGGASCDEVGFYPVHPAHPVEKSAFNRRIRIAAKSSDSRGARLLSDDHEARSSSTSGSHLGSQTRPELTDDRMNRVYRMKSGGASCDEVGFYPVHPAHPVEKSAFNRRVRIVANKPLPDPISLKIQFPIGWRRYGPTLPATITSSTRRPGTPMCSGRPKRRSPRARRSSLTGRKRKSGSGSRRPSSRED